MSSGNGRSRTDQSGTLTLDSLNKTYGAQVAIRDISLSIPQGQFVTLLGPSGSGKTTILMAIAGFVQPTSGTIHVGDRNITALPPENRNFGMMFQGYALFPHMTVAENVWFPLRVRGQSRVQAADRVRRALEMVQLTHLSDRRPGQLSGGQQQRTALARALVYDPDVILLDEPLSALDKNLRHDLQLELKALHERLGVTFVYVTHDQDEALSMSDHIVILRDGQVQQKGSPEDLFERPATRFVADFLGKSNFVVGQVSRSEGNLFRYTAGRYLLSQAGTGPAHGEVVIALRPQKIAASLHPPNTDNVVVGIVKAASYFGTTNYLVVDCEGIGSLNVVVPAGATSEVARIGAHVRLGWNADTGIAVSS